MEIKLLTLQTDKLQSMKEFYTKHLGFSLCGDSPKSFRIQVGKSMLEFTNSNGAREPFYHFAMNIPSNQFQEAKAWLKEKKPLLLEDGEDEADFSFWPAHSCYFEDPAGNIVEFIARYNVTPTSELPFSNHSILNIGEIGLISHDAPMIGEQLKTINIVNSDDSPITNSKLSFMQESNNGVFIILAGPGRRWLFSEKKSKVFPMKIILDNQFCLGINEDQEFFMCKSSLNYKEI
ncbi:VOC family protein [Solibacillus sp. R5-41]|uniref:VOC family protein n=1 Tax=Solibacillus sp. R5-41 TaxID=2048654 RepID=UPI001562B822|nr:VOC family protein [Solibacillus sp. R5-41]